MSGGRAWWPVGAEILRQKLGLPEDTQIVGARTSGTSGIELLIESPKLTDVIPLVEAEFIATKKGSETVETISGFVPK